MRYAQVRKRGKDPAPARVAQVRPKSKPRRLPVQNLIRNRWFLTLAIAIAIAAAVTLIVVYSGGGGGGGGY
jgi:hypothetical protein